MEKAIKTIQVNNGYIQLDLSKPERIRAFSRRIQVAGKRAEKDGKTDTLLFRKKAADAIEMLFGQGACRRIFGTNLPEMEWMAEFLKKLTPLVRKWMEEM